MTKPFIKWVGGKGKLVGELVQRVPKMFNNYYELFLGGGALFWSLGIDNKCVLNDSNERLIRTYRAIRDKPNEVISALKLLKYDREEFYRVRVQNIDTLSDVEVAVWFIYLNKTCFNGLYRVNKDNKFNVPFGSYANPTICDEQNLIACSKRLQNVDILSWDYLKLEEVIKEDDFCYFDPPYIPISATSSFASYTKDGFDMKDHIALRDLLLRLKHKGVKILLSNSDTPITRELYKLGFVIENVMVGRSVNSDSTKRGKVSELLIT